MKLLPTVVEQQLELPLDYPDKHNMDAGTAFIEGFGG